MMYGYGYGPEFGFVHVLNVVFWILLIVIAIKFIRHGRGWRSHGGPWGGSWNGGYDRSMEILKERYAKGEINKEEFEAKKKDLMG
ncbi:SHOCT domain-containing protein [Candidatus Parcubacteria bacterium]|nr:SHOCT domain-containing protein [Candidatus Parcubacteria bacterium]